MSQQSSLQWGGLTHQPLQTQPRPLVRSQCGNVEMLWNFFSGEGSVHHAFFTLPNT